MRSDLHFNEEKLGSERPKFVLMTSICVQVNVPEVGHYFDRLVMRRQDPLPLAKSKMLMPVN